MKINNHDIEFIEETHTYLVDGVIVPSVTTIIAEEFETDFKVSDKKLKIASMLGTEMHKDIENYERYGTLSDTLEFKNYLFLKEKYNFKNIDNELIVLYEENGVVLYIGKLDQIIELNNKIGVNDFKRVSSFDRKKVEMQLTLYAIAYEQTYKKRVDFISGTHLKNEKRKFYDNLKRDDKKGLKIVKKYYEKRNLK